MCRSVAWISIPCLGASFAYRFSLGDRPVTGCLFALAAIVLNMGWTHLLAAGPGRMIVGKWLEATKIMIPEMPAHNWVKMTLILRLTPRIPFFLQSYVQGFPGVPFRIYLPVSIICNGVFTCGFMLGGAGNSSGKIGLTVSRVSIQIVAVVVLKWLRSQRLRMEADNQKAGDRGQRTDGQMLEASLVLRPMRMNELIVG
jgi:uncharacterized membrane protein YdjX (TVP38/TMEM64 family)